MRISTKTRYGTRAMLNLAVHYGQGALELKEIARNENISLKYLEQVITPLRTAGLVKSLRGSKGGYSLGKPPSQIFLRDIVEVLEGPPTLVDCVQDDKACARSPSCVTREIWGEVSKAIYGILNAVSLEEMVNRKRRKESGLPI